jgi:5-methylcytosine-specific restriction endonuclease McrA
MARPGWSSKVARQAREYWRDKLPLTCPRCGNSVEAAQAWDVDHLVPLSQGGDPGAENQWPAHRSCNRRHGQRLGSSRRSGSGGFRPWA